MGIAHPVVGPSFRYRKCVRRRRSLEADIEKKSGFWLQCIFCKTYIRMLNFDICLYKNNVI